MQVFQSFSRFGTIYRYRAGRVGKVQEEDTLYHTGRVTVLIRIGNSVRGILRIYRYVESILRWVLGTCMDTVSDIHILVPYVCTEY